MMGLVGNIHPPVYPPARLLVIGYDEQLVLEQYFDILKGWQILFHLAFTPATTESCPNGVAELN